MNTPATLIALCASVLALGACDKTPTAPPTPTVIGSVPTDPAATAPVDDPSLPSAESVFPGPNASSTDASPGRPDGTRNTAQEAIGIPIPGQNNDHSAPAVPAQPASAP